MNNSKIWIAVVVVAIIAILGVFTPQGTTVVERTVERLGASAGPEHQNHQYFRQGFTKGGRSVATTTPDTLSSFTLTTAEIDENTSYLAVNPGINLTLTTMASTSAPLVNLGVGESLEVYLYNASTTAAATITLAAGTGVDLQEDEGETVIVNGLEVARLTFLKKADSDVISWLEVGQVGD